MILLLFSAQSEGVVFLNHQIKLEKQLLFWIGAKSPNEGSCGASPIGQLLALFSGITSHKKISELADGFCELSSLMCCANKRSR